MSENVQDANMVNPSVTNAVNSSATHVVNPSDTLKQAGLQSNESSPIIEPQGNAGAAPRTGAEDAAGYQAIIEQQQAQIDALIARNESLTGQFARLIANGAQIGEPATAAQQQQQQQQQQQMQQSPYADLPSLADIGKDMANKG